MRGRIARRRQCLSLRRRCLSSVWHRIRWDIYTRPTDGVRQAAQSPPHRKVRRKDAVLVCETDLLAPKSTRRPRLPLSDGSPARTPRRYRGDPYGSQPVDVTATHSTGSVAGCWNCDRAGEHARRMVPSKVRQNLGEEMSAAWPTRPIGIQKQRPRLQKALSTHP